MAETTTAQAPVEQGPTSEDSVTDILQSAFGGGDQPVPRAKPEQPEAAPEQEAAADADSDEPNLDDLPDDDPAPQSADTAEFEIVHNGTQHKLSRADTIKLAQQGFDYTQKTQAVAESYKAAQAALQRVQEVEQMVPQVAHELAMVKAYESQLHQYQNVDWVRLATEDPLEYPKHRAQYDQLVQGYQAANHQFQQKTGQVQQAREALTRQRAEQERPKLLERIPTWSKPEVYQAEATKLSGWLVKQGADPAEVAALSDSLAVSIAYKAMKYDQLVSDKAAKSKQLRAAPPVVRPGAVVPSDNGRLNALKAATAIKKAGSRNDHRTQERMMEQLLGKAFK